MKKSKINIKEQLLSPDERVLYERLKVDVEPNFGQVKANLGFTRFFVRGHSKPENETNLVFVAKHFRKHNKRKQL